MENASTLGPDHALNSSLGNTLPIHVISGPFLVSNEVRNIILSVNYGILCPVSSTIGVITNTMNMVVFAKIGFSQTINISLFCLAISQFLTSVALITNSTAYLLLIYGSYEPYFHVHLTISLHSSVCFGRLAGLMYAKISLERCICILLPLRAKLFNKPCQTIGVVIFFCSVTILTTMPGYTNAYIVWRLDPATNRSISFLDHTSWRGVIARVFVFVNVLLAYGSFLTVAASTVLTAVALHKKSRWREEATAAKGEHAISNSSDQKEQRVIRMVVVMSTIFIVTTFPNTILTILHATGPVYDMKHELSNFVWSFTSITSVLWNVNSSFNTIVYYRMSSIFRLTARKTIFLHCTSE